MTVYPRSIGPMRIPADMPIEYSFVNIFLYTHTRWSQNDFLTFRRKRNTIALAVCVTGVIKLQITMELRGDRYDRIVRIVDGLKNFKTNCVYALTDTSGFVDVNASGRL